VNSIIKERKTREASRYEGVEVVWNSIRTWKITGVCYEWKIHLVSSNYQDSTSPKKYKPISQEFVLVLTFSNGIT
jgi:hypothetical protein